MAIAALITWLATALGGLAMLGMWISRGGARGSTRLPAPVVFGHVALAAIGLVLWIIYLFTDTPALAWIAFVLLLPVALMGFGMLARWIPEYRARAATPAQRAAVGRSGAASSAGHAESAAPAERAFPVPVVVGHGLFAVATVILALLSAAGVGGR